MTAQPGIITSRTADPLQQLIIACRCLFVFVQIIIITKSLRIAYGLTF
jgi:hypothetical protein